MNPLRSIFGRRQRRRRKKDCLPTGSRATGLNAYEACYTSQNGEDGIIAEIFRRIGTTNTFSVEFGVEDGSECNTAELLRRHGWRGVLIEGDPRRFAALARRYEKFSNVRTIQAYVDVAGIKRILAAAEVPHELDLLSIDVDGNDYWIAQEILSEYRPRLIVIEINPFYPPPARWVMPYDPNFRWDDTTYFGASLSSMTDLHEAHGYSLVAIDCNVINAFYLRNDLLPALGLPPVVPEAVYHFTPMFPGRRYRHI